MRRSALALAPSFALSFAYSVISTLASCITLAAALFAGLTGGALAQSADDVRGDFARAVYLHSALQVHDERPQPLLRAVVVLRVTLDAQNHWQAEVFRENAQQPDMTRAALASVARLPAPVGLSTAAQDLLRGDGFIEAWLFQNDGRFALKTLARPQRSS